MNTGYSGGGYMQFFFFLLLIEKNRDRVAEKKKQCKKYLTCIEKCVYVHIRTKRRRVLELNQCLIFD